MTIEDLKPADTPDYMIPAWLGCLSWAINEPKVVAAFRAETGFTWEPGRSGIECMIDEACGMPEKFIEAFVPWVNANIWGPMDGEDPEGPQNNG